MTQRKRGPVRIGGEWTKCEWLDFLSIGPDPLIQMMRQRAARGSQVDQFWQSEIDAEYIPPDSEIATKWAQFRGEILEHNPNRKPWAAIQFDD